jgi:hypothetical protein
MYGSHVIATDYWRHHVPFAPDLEVNVIVGQKVEIPVVEHWRQGARYDYDHDPDAVPDHTSPDPTIVPARMPVQRGWLLDPILAIPGRKGIVGLSTYKNGFVYTPNVDRTTEQDCFNYQFSNGTQKSNYGKVLVNIQQPFLPEWKIYSPTRDVYYPGRDSNYYSSMTIRMIPNAPGYVNGRYQVFKWYTRGPELEMRDGVPYIVQKTRLLHETRAYIYYTSVSYIDNGRTLPARTFRNDKHLVGIDERTNAPYIPTGKFPELWIEYFNYPRIKRTEYYSYIDRSYVERQTIRVQNHFGINWQRSGKILIG